MFIINSRYYEARKVKMKKTLKVIIGIFGYFVMISALSCFIAYFGKFMSLVSGIYPAAGDYYISFEESEEHVIKAKVIYLQEIYDEPVDLSNLALYIEEDKNYSVEKDIIYDDNKIRKMLLEQGLAQIIDEDKATREELSYQSEAVKKEKGIWYTGDNKAVNSIHMIYNEFMMFLESNMGRILKWIIFTGFGISTIYYFIKKRIMKRRIDTILMGGISSGKTTILKRIERPNITEGKLLAEATTTKTGEVVKCDRVAYKNKDIYPYLFDNPGDQYGKMIDAINKFGITKSDKKVLIYVISFTKSDSSPAFDVPFTHSQISKAAVLVKSFKTSSSLTKVSKIIIFFNKCDLLYQKEVEYLENIKNIEKKYRESLDYGELTEYADKVIFGSALKGWGIDELKEEILSVY